MNAVTPARASMLSECMAARLRGPCWRSGMTSLAPTRARAGKRAAAAGRHAGNACVPRHARSAVPVREHLLPQLARVSQEQLRRHADNASLPFSVRLPRSARAREVRSERSGHVMLRVQRPCAAHLDQQVPLQANVWRDVLHLHRCSPKLDRKIRQHWVSRTRLGPACQAAPTSTQHAKPTGAEDIGIASGNSINLPGIMRL